MYIILVALAIGAGPEIAVIVRPGEPPWARAGDDTARITVPASGLGTAVVMSRTEGWLELSFRTSDAEECPRPASERPPYERPQFDLRLWTRETSLARLVTRRIEQHWGQDTVVVHPGWVGPGDGPSLESVISQRLPDDAWGTEFVVSSEAGPPAAWASERRLGWTGEVVLDGVSWPVHARERTEMSPPAADGRARLLLDSGCVELSAITRDLSGAGGPVTQFGSGGLGSSRPSAPMELSAGARVTWPDGSPAGSILRPVQLGASTREGGRTCGTLRMAGVWLKVCAANRDVR